MQDRYHFVEGVLTFFGEHDGGKSRPVASGYRGQFHYAANDKPFDVIWLFPDHDRKWVFPGDSVNVRIGFLSKRWNEVHKFRCSRGVEFEVREGSKTIADGRIHDIAPPYRDVALLNETWEYPHGETG